MAERVAVELVRLDSLSSELTYIQGLLDLTTKKVALQDSVIKVDEQRIENYQSQIGTHKEMFSACTARVEDLEKQVKVLSRRNKILKGVAKGLGGGILACIAGVLVLFSIK